MKVLIGFLSILAFALAKPSCNYNELQTLWPDQESKSHYYQCVSTGKSFRMPCSSKTWFLFDQQKCVNKNQWTESDPSNIKSTNLPIFSMPSSTSKFVPQTPTPSQPPFSTKYVTTTNYLNGKTHSYEGPPTPVPTQHPMPPTPPPTAPTLPKIPNLKPESTHQTVGPSTEAPTTTKKVSVPVKKRKPKVVPTRAVRR